MRQECQAVVIRFKEGDSYSATHVTTADCCREVFENHVICGRPAVDAADDMRLLPEQPGMGIFDRIQRIKFPLCAEHWDERKRNEIEGKNND